MREDMVNFNPRPREEGDTISTAAFARSGNFNPRPREEGDVTPAFSAVRASIISIHALVKRATQTSWKSKSAIKYFNPRPREEGDKRERRLSHVKLTFQSTPS